jgi:transcriptional regulator with XRE-family HTH domain
MNNQALWQRIEQVLKERKMNFSELSRELDLSPQAIQSWSVKGIDRVSRLMQVSQVLGVSPRWLMFGDEAEPREIIPPAIQLIHTIGHQASFDDSDWQFLEDVTTSLARRKRLKEKD